MNTIRILLIDDNRHEYLIIDRSLGKSRLSYTLTWSQDGSSALTLLEQESFDVLLLDLNLTGQDGLAVFRRMLAEGIVLPTIFVTGQGSEQVAVEAIQLGAVNYLVKDVTGDYLQILPTIIQRAFVQQQESHLRQLAEEARRESEERLRATLVSMDDDVLVLDAGGRLLDFYKSDQSKLPIAVGAWRHRSYHELLPAGLATLVAAAVDELLESSQVVQFDYSTVSETIRHWFNAKVSIRRDQIGEFAGVTVVIRDITPLKEAEANLAANTRQLEEQNADLDAFAHMVAHDLKAPLANIFGFAELLDYEEPSSEEFQQAIKIIQKNSQQMGRIIDELLLLASLHRQHYIPITQLAMFEIVQGACDRLEYVIQKERPEFIFPDSWLIAYGYAPWIEEIWANLISNAIKYGGRPARIELGCDQPNGSEIRFWIRDNGAGIPLEEQSKLFAPFTQLGKVHGLGHGLGLSIIKRIIEQSGGNVSVESDGQSGTEFWFTLPALPPPESELLD